MSAFLSVTMYSYVTLHNPSQAGKDLSCATLLFLYMYSSTINIGWFTAQPLFGPYICPLSSRVRSSNSFVWVNLCVGKIHPEDLLSLLVFVCVNITTSLTSFFNSLWKTFKNGNQQFAYKTEMFACRHKNKPDTAYIAYIKTNKHQKALTKKKTFNI